MNLIHNKKLVLKHTPGQGFWSFFIQIPNTSEIEKNQRIVVEGKIDKLHFGQKDLIYGKGKNRYLFLPKKFIDAIGKAGNRIVTASVDVVLVKESLKKENIFSHFDTCNVMEDYLQLSVAKQFAILIDIVIQPTLTLQKQKLEWYTNALGTRTIF